MSALDKIKQLNKSAEQLDYERDQAKLAQQSAFESAPLPDSPLERWATGLTLAAVGCGLLYIGLPFLNMGLNPELRLYQRGMIAGVGVIAWAGAAWVFVRAYSKIKGR